MPYWSKFGPGKQSKLSDSTSKTTAFPRDQPYTYLIKFKGNLRRKDFANPTKLVIITAYPSLMSPIRLKKNLTNRVLTVLTALFVLTANGYAASMKSGFMSTSENAEAIRSYGTYLSIAMLGLIAFLLVFRGREIRSQHPKSFH